MTLRQPLLARIRALVLVLVAAAAAPAAAQLRDPTAPPRDPAAAHGAMRATPSPVSVTALFLAADGSRAIVNGEVVRSGDVRHGIEILAIEADGVRYRRGGQVAFASLARPDLAVKTAVEEKNP